MKKSKNVLNYLFIIIVLNMIPTIMLQVFNISGTIYTLLSSIAYMSSIMLCLLIIIKNKPKISKSILYLVLLIISLAISLAMDQFKFSRIMTDDIIASTSMCINIFIYIILFSKFTFTKKEFTSFINKITVVGIIACIYNIIVNGSGFFHIFSLYSSYSVSFSSFFPNRNQFGLFMLICILAKLYTYNGTKKDVLIISLFAFNLIFTMARNAILGLFIILFYLMFTYMKNNKYHVKKKYAFVFLILFLLLSSFIVYIVYEPSIYNNITRLFIRTDEAFDSGRFTAWGHGIYIAKFNMLFGVGRFMALYFNKSIFASTVSHFHSNYVELFVSYGIVGMVLYLILLKKVFSNCIRIKDLWLKKIAILNLIVFLVVGCFETICRFSIGYIDTLTIIYFFALPIMLSKSTNSKNWLE